MKKPRTTLHDRFFALFAGGMIGALFSPVVWLAFRIEDFWSGAILTVAMALVFGVIAALACEKNAGELLTFIIRLLNP